MKEMNEDLGYISWYASNFEGSEDGVEATTVLRVVICRFGLQKWLCGTSQKLLHFHHDG